MKILLIAKPWRGGLAKYVYLALNERYPGCVEWISTRPSNTFQQAGYRLNKAKWTRKLIAGINSSDRDIAVFINTFKGFEGIADHPGNVLWLTDAPKPGPEGYASMAKVFCSDPGYLDIVASAVPTSRIGGELGFACCPQVHCWNDDRSEKKQICFIGNKDPKRDPYLAELLTSGYSLSIIGNYYLRHSLFWRRPQCFSASVANEEMGRVYSRHAVSLNIHAQIIKQGTNMRTFECAAYGIPQLVEYSPGIEKYFDINKEIIVFTTAAEMLEKLDWLLENHSTRRDLAEAAKQRVLSEHTYQHRLDSLLGVLN